MNIKIFMLIFACAVSETISAKILGVFPIPAISHQVVFRKLSQELHNRGHELTVLTPNPAYAKGQAPENYTEIDFHDASYALLRTTFQKDYKIEGNTFTFQVLRQMNPIFMKIIELHFQSREVQEIIAKNKYDLVLLESVVLSGLIYSHIFKAPVILVSSFPGYINEHKIMGTPTYPIWYPLSLRNKIYNLSYYEKLRELYRHYSNEYAEYLNEIDNDRSLKEMFGPQTPSLNQLSNNIRMLFLNVHPIWSDNKPTTPNIIYMGGIHQVPHKELPKELLTYLNASKHGVIYLSFGTNSLSHMIPSDKIDNIINVLSKLPYDILWKWDRDELPRKSKNIRISKWFPQSDLLRHPKIKLFITQAGLQSTDEAITAGVPLVAIPMFGDQWYNAEKYEKFGIGIQLDVTSFSEDQLTNAVNTVLNNKSYRLNIKNLREIILDQPMTSIERSMWWIEYVLRHPEKNHLRTLASNLSYAEYLDICPCLRNIDKYFSEFRSLRPKIETLLPIGNLQKCSYLNTFARDIDYVF